MVLVHQLFEERIKCMLLIRLASRCFSIHIFSIILEVVATCQNTSHGADSNQRDINLRKYVFSIDESGSGMEMDYKKKAPEERLPRGS